jgi:hypothetical protein
VSGRLQGDPSDDVWGVMMSCADGVGISVPGVYFSAGGLMQLIFTRYIQRYASL